MNESLGVSRIRFQKRQRLLALLVGLMLVGLALSLTLNALEDNIIFFYSPTDLREKSIAPGEHVRVGGLVENGSWIRPTRNTSHKFVITDGANKITAIYKGILPDLFREGQGVVLEGTLQDKEKFIATEVLAKHDENYMPREVADALKKAGYWNQFIEKSQDIK